MHGAGGTKAGAQIVDADDKEMVGVERLARAYHVVPPAFGLFLPGIDACHVMRGIECMADQHGIRSIRVEPAVGLKTQGVIANLRAALQRQNGGKVHRLWRGNHQIKNPAPLKAEPGWRASLAELIKRPQAVANRRPCSISTLSMLGKHRCPARMACFGHPLLARRAVAPVSGRAGSILARYLLWFGALLGLAVFTHQFNSFNSKRISWKH